MAVSGSKSFIPCVVSPHIVAEATRAARNWVLFCSPGITLLESDAIVEAGRRMDSQSIWGLFRQFGKRLHLGLWDR